MLGDFHTLLADIVGNLVLKEILRKLTARTSLIAMHQQSSEDASCSSDEHALFIEAAKAGNADAAVDIMLHHLDHVLKALHVDARESVDKKDLVKALLAA